MAEPTVRLSGTVLASLMFQHLNSDSDAEGLILGESSLQEQITISDSQADHIHIEETYNIQTHVCCNKLHSFYNSVGEVDLDALQEMLGDTKQERVMGWYRQRRGSDQRMTFREKLVHERLRKALSRPHALFLLLTPSQLAAAGSTHRTDYAAFIARRQCLVKVPVLVANLGLLGQLAYWTASGQCSSAGYELIAKKHSSRFFSSDGFLREVAEVSDMNSSLQEQLQKACGEVEESERRVEALQAEVGALRASLAHRRRRWRLEQQQQQQQQQRRDGAEPPTEHAHQKQLQDAIRALLLHSPLFLTQTLTLGAEPVMDGAETPRPSPPASRKGASEWLQGRKRRRNKT